MSNETIATEEQLNDLLTAMNFEQGEEPVVVGFDAHGHPFLAYGWASGGDGWDCGFVNDDPHSAEFDYSDGTTRCEECGAFDRRGIAKLAYPVHVVQPPVSS